MYSFKNLDKKRRKKRKKRKITRILKKEAAKVSIQHFFGFVDSFFRILPLSFRIFYTRFLRLLLNVFRTFLEFISFGGSSIFKVSNVSNFKVSSPSLRYHQIERRRNQSGNQRERSPTEKYIHRNIPTPTKNTWNLKKIGNNFKKKTRTIKVFFFLLCVLSWNEWNNEFPVFCSGFNKDLHILFCFLLLYQLASTAPPRKSWQCTEKHKMH